MAIDQATIDLCFAAEGSESLKRRVERLDGLHTLEHGEEIGLGSRTYNLIDIQEETPSDGESVATPDSEEQAAKAAMKKAKIKNLKVTGKKGTISLSWEKLDSATGYQVQISRTGNFKKKGIVFDKKVKRASAKASGGQIEKKKTYYARVRAYVAYTNEAGEKLRAYGSWVKKKAKTK